MDQRARGLSSSLASPRWVSGCWLGSLVREPWQLLPDPGALAGGGVNCLAYTGQSLYLTTGLCGARGLALSIALFPASASVRSTDPTVVRLADRHPPDGARRASGSASSSSCCFGPLNLLLKRRPEDFGHDAGRHRTRQPPRRPQCQYRRSIAGPRWTGRFGARCVPAASGGSRSPISCGLFSWYAVQVHQTKYLIEAGFAPILAAWASGSSASSRFRGRSRSVISPTASAANGYGRSANFGFVVCCLALIGLHRDAQPGAALCDDRRARDDSATA